MSTFEHLPMLLAFAFVLSLFVGTQVNAQVVPLAWIRDSQAKLEKELMIVLKVTELLKYEEERDKK